MYAHALQQHHSESILPIPCLFFLGETAETSVLSEWSEFNHEVMDASMACAGWILEKIRAGVFGPPVDKVDYDDYIDLSAGRKLSEMFQLP
jgi:hypothetical protein